MQTDGQTISGRVRSSFSTLAISYGKVSKQDVFAPSNQLEGPQKLAKPLSHSLLRAVDKILLREMPGAGTRLRILVNVLDLHKTCNEISRTLDMSWGSINDHLLKLRNAGLLEETKIGRTCYYGKTSWGENAVRELG
jgi:DNA-binding transcriptional ArsR family regulator